MILRLLLILVILFALLVVFQDQPPVAKFVASLPPQVGQALQQTRALCTGRTTVSTPAISPQAQQTLDKVGQTLEDVGQKTGDEAKKVEGEIQQQISTNSAPQPTQPTPPADQTPAPTPDQSAPAPAPAPTPAPAQ